MIHRIRINKATGCVEWLAPPPFLIPVEKQSRRRFSEIVPVALLPRILFRLLRLLFGERGKVAAWTRTWCVMWRAKILIGKHKGKWMEHAFREVLLQWEREIFFEPLTKELQ